MTGYCRLIITTEQYQEYLKLKEEDNHWHKEAERISHEAIGARLEVITLEKQLNIAFKILRKFAFDYDDTTKARVFIENSLTALGEMREAQQ